MNCMAFGVKNTNAAGDDFNKPDRIGQKVIQPPDEKRRSHPAGLGQM